MTDSPSRTSLLVARGVWLVACTPRLGGVMPEDLAGRTREILERSRSSRFVALARRRWFRSIAFRLERFVLPGICLHYVLRKRFIERRVEGAIAAGARRVIVLGAGLDTLSLRLAGCHREVEFVEVDHPATQRAKAPLVADARIRLIPADLSSSDGIRALFSSLDSGIRTAYVAEGLLMYLPGECVEALFRAIASSGGGACVIFSTMGLLADGRPGFRESSPLIARWLARRREPFLWGIAPEDIPTWLSPLGLTQLESADANTLRAEFAAPPDEPIAEGENLYTAGSGC